MPRRRYAGREGQAPEGLRSLRSLRPLPSSSASSLRDNLLPKGPSPCPCPGVDTPSGACPPCPAPHDGNHPSGSKRGDGNLSDECRCGRRSLRQDFVADECRCGGRLLRMNVYAAGCCCGGEIVLRPNHRMRRGQGATPAAFYLGLCRLRCILSPPAPHDCAAGGPFLTAAAMTLRRSASLGLKSRIDAALALRRRSAGGPFFFTAAKNRIGRGSSLPLRP